MSDSKASDRALDHAVRKSFDRMYSMNQAREGLRRSFLVFGITAALLLPLTSKDAPSSGTPTVTVEPPIINVEPKVEVEVLPVPVPDPLEVTVGEVSPKVTVVLDEVQVMSMPPISKQWHRARFNKTNDTFWAIPSMDFQLRLESDPGQCNRASCSANLRFLGDDFSINDTPVVVEQRRVTSTNTAMCHQVRPDHDYYLECIVYRSSRENTLDGGVELKPDICMQLRRSEVLEKEGEENAALDIRWLSIDWDEEIERLEELEEVNTGPVRDAKSFGFLNLGPHEYSQKYVPSQHAEDPWYDSVCDFPRF